MGTHDNEIEFERVKLTRFQVYEVKVELPSGKYLNVLISAKTPEEAEIEAFKLMTEVRNVSNSWMIDPEPAEAVQVLPAGV